MRVRELRVVTKNYYWNTNNQGINAIGIVTRRKKINAITQGHHGNPYLVINLLLLLSFVSWFSQCSLVNIYTLFLTALSAHSVIFQWHWAFSRFSVNIYMDRLSVLSDFLPGIMQFPKVHYTISFRKQFPTFGSLLFSSLNNLNYAYLFFQD